MNQTVSLTLQILLQLNDSRAPYLNDANIVVLNPAAISHQSPPPVQPATLPDGYIAYPEIGAAYKVIPDKVRWSEAREQCNLEGAHLAILDSRKKLEYVTNATCHAYGCHLGNWFIFHTGIYRMDEKWVDVSTGTTLSDLHWYTGFPDKCAHDCVTVEIYTIGKSWLFNAYNCSTKLAYICEVPIPKDYKTQENQIVQISVK